MKTLEPVWKARTRKYAFKIIDGDGLGIKWLAN